MSRELSLSMSFSIGGDLYQTEHDEASVALYFDQGNQAIRLAISYLRNLWEYHESLGDEAEPMDVHVIMVDFIRHLTKHVVIVTSNYRLFPSSMYGPPTDLGHFIFQTTCPKIEHYSDSPWPTILNHRDINGSERKTP